MITKEYVNFIYNKSFVEKMISPHNTILLVELPNGYCFSVSGANEDICTLLAKTEIDKLESYLQVDKEHYGYDIEGEYE